MAAGCGCEKDACHISMENPVRASRETLQEVAELRTGAPNVHWARRIIQPCLPQKVVAEMVGTFAIVFAGELGGSCWACGLLRFWSEVNQSRFTLAND